MNEQLETARDELIKRADHLIYVSLKYTRTCDVLMHVIERFINTEYHIFQFLLEKLKEDGTIAEIPTTPIQRANLIKEQFAEDPQIVEHANFLLKLRKINKAPFSRSTEFRRHVTMTSTLPDDTIVETHIDSVTEDFKKIRAFLEYITEKYGGA